MELVGNKVPAGLAEALKEHIKLEKSSTEQRIAGLIFILFVFIRGLKYVEYEIPAREWEETGFLPLIPGEIPG